MSLQYNFTKLLGKGAFGFVKEAETLDGLLIAVKIYKSNSMDVSADIIREINTMKLIDHPNVIKLIQVKASSGNIEIAIQHGGTTLTKYMFTLLDFHREEKALSLFSQMLLAVSYMHKIGIIHRDLKPDNILIKDDIVRICDFSIAKKIIPSRENAHTYKIGTNNYNAPELFGEKPKDYSIKIDIWALGCTFYEFLTKKILFKGTTDLSVITLILRVLQPSESEMYNAGLHEMRTPSYKITDTFKVISNENIRNIICSMLKFNAVDRISAQDALEEIQRTMCSDLKHEIDENKTLMSKYNNRRYGENFYVKPTDYAGINRKRRMDCVDLIESLCTNEKQTFLLAVNIFDRYTCCIEVSQNLVNKNSEIIAHISCFIASKYIDLRPIHLDHLELEYHVDEIIDWELRILKTLDFNICGPTFLDIYRFTINNKVSEDHWKVICSWIRDSSLICGKSAQDIKLLMKKTFT